MNTEEASAALELADHLDRIDERFGPPIRSMIGSIQELQTERDQLRAEVQRLREIAVVRLSCDTCITRDRCPKRGKPCMYHEHDQFAEESAPSPDVVTVPREEWDREMRRIVAEDSGSVRRIYASDWERRIERRNDLSAAPAIEEKETP